MPNVVATAKRLPTGWGLRTVGLLAGALGGLAGPAQAQAPAPDSLAAIGRQLQRQEQQAVVEKLYVHLDRPAYAARETMWFKLYAADGTLHQPLDLSKVAYVEVLNGLHQPVLQAQVTLRGATGQGALDLPATLPTGRYLVRAYTSWMKNFDPEFYFQTPVSILNTFAASGGWAPAPTAAQLLDVQFFPEGGQLVQGVPSRVAFRVANATGQGQAATGTVHDAQGRTVATLRTLRPGLGSFELTPAAAGAYTAVLQLASGQTVTQKLPAAAPQGYALRLSEAGPAQLRLRVVAQGVGPDAAHLALVGHSGQRVATAQVATPNSRGEAEFLIDKSALLPGISHFTIFNARRQPVGERLYFRRPQPLPLAVAPDQPRYGPRSKVTLRLALPAASAPARVSVAVYQLDSLAADAAPAGISSVLSLTSDLRGTVEQPDYYLRDSSRAGQQALDNLLLTHGWSRFRWPDVLAGRPPALPYPPELAGPLGRGQVLTAAGAPAPGITAYLAAPSRTARFYAATSGPDGTVQFEPKNAYGPRTYVLQTDWRRDSTYRLALLSPYSARYASRPLAPLGLGPALAADLARRHVQAQLPAIYYGRYQQYRLPPADTVAFYGTPPAQYRLDDFTRFKVLDEVLREYVQGVYLRPRPDGLHIRLADGLHHALFEEDPLVVLDGVPLFNIPQLLAFDPLRLQRVAVFTNRYYYGAQDYAGLLSFSTYRGDLQDFPLDPRALLEAYDGLQGQRDFFAPRYDAAPSTLPDLRNLLHWEPDLALAAGTPRELTFFTSDQAGRYRVVVQGLAANGQAGSATATFEVKPAL